MTIFITGDRSMGAAYLPLVAIEMLRAVAQGSAVATGENPGVESLVRDLGERAGVEVQVLPGGKPDFDTRHAAVASSGWDAVVIHSEPHSSSLVPSLLAAFADDDDRVRIVTHADLMI